MPTSRLRIVSIERVIAEASHTKSFCFRVDSKSRSGQFVMIWIPGVGEVPMTLSRIGPIKAVTAKNAGGPARILYKLEEGDKIGVRGPSGTHFDLSQERYLVAAGGAGIAAVVAACESLSESGKKVVTVFGAKTKGDLILLDRVQKCGEVLVATDDGSMGYHGTVSDLARKLVEERRFDGVIAGGQEEMLRYLVQLCRKRDVEIQVSLERLMRCGMGICGSCTLDGYLVCADGPVFRGDQLADLKDFGEYRRDRAGRRVPL